MDVGLGDGIISTDFAVLTFGATAGVTACPLVSAQADRTLKVNNIVRQIWCLM